MWEYESTNLLQEVYCTVLMSNTAYEIMAKKRSCLIAQTDIWWRFIAPFWKEKGREAMPCSADKTKCTAVAEAEQCKRGEASTTSCPIYDENPDSLLVRADWMGHDHPAIQYLASWRPDLSTKIKKIPLTTVS